MRTGPGVKRILFALPLLGAINWPLLAADDDIRNAREMIEVLDAYTVYKMGQYDLAFQRYLVLAKNGSRQGMLNVGNMYAQGQGVAQNHENAVYWYRKSAEAGDAISMEELGKAYANGRGVTADPELSTHWYLKSAEKNNAEAQWVIGKQLYEQGDKLAGLDWIRTAAHRNGQPGAQQFLAQLADDESGQPLIDARQRKAVLTTLSRIDEALQAGNSEPILQYLAPGAQIRVRLPQSPAWQPLTAVELAGLWQANFDRNPVYYYQRVEPDLVATDENRIMAFSRIREWFGPREGAADLEIHENAELAIQAGGAVIHRLRLDIREPGQ
jgi:hypothetical protein